MKSNSKKMPRVDCVLWGGYSWGNTGDEMMLAVAIKDKQEQYGDSLIVLSPNPDYTQWLFPNVAILPYQPQIIVRWRRRVAKIKYGWPIRSTRNKPVPAYRFADQIAPAENKQWLQAIASAKELYLVGGGYYTDLWDTTFIDMPIEAARRFRIPIRSAPIGVGPFFHEKSRQRFSDLFCNRSLTVRDLVSLDLCRQTGVDVEIKPDDGFRFFDVSPHPTIDMNPKEAKTPIGIDFYIQHGTNRPKAVFAWWSRLLQELANEQLDLGGFCFHTRPQHDFFQAIRLFSETGLSLKTIKAPEPDFRMAVAQVAQYRLIISCRFHAIVAASLYGVPHIAIASGAYYKQKMAAALRSDSTPGCIIDPEKDAIDRTVEFIKTCL